MRFKKMAMGYTGRGYRSTARSPYGYEAPRGLVASNDEDVWSSEDKDSCDLLDDVELDCREGNTGDRGDPSRDLVGLEAKRSSPQSLVKSHQNEYNELITADISLIACKVGEVQRGPRTNIPKTKEWVFTMPSLLGDGTPASLH
jgi:hypothetical protein